MSTELHNVGALLACITDDRTRAVYSAAPELLAALEEFADSQDCTCVDLETLNISGKCRVCKAIDAIAKARSE